jgi:hypothetical protein
MKQLFAVLAIAGSLVACNNASESTENKIDSIDSAADQRIEAIDSAAEQKTEAIDSAADAKIDTLQKKD